MNKSGQPMLCFISNFVFRFFTFWRRKVDNNLRIFYFAPMNILKFFFFLNVKTIYIMHIPQIWSTLFLSTYFILAQSNTNPMTIPLQLYIWVLELLSVKNSVEKTASDFHSVTSATIMYDAAKSMWTFYANIATIKLNHVIFIKMYVKRKQKKCDSSTQWFTSLVLFPIPLSMMPPNSFNVFKYFLGGILVK